MQLPGVLGTISLVLGLMLALPMALIGVEFLFQGRVPMGLGFLGLAAALLFLPEFVIRRFPRPWRGLRKRFRRSNEDEGS